MAKLQHITFTGVDGKTDIFALEELQRKYPIAEFGVLVSQNWWKNGNRYFNPSFLRELAGLNLSAHFCGSIARYAAKGHFEYFLSWARSCHRIFKRCQLNIASSAGDISSFNNHRVGKSLFREVILQQKSANECELFQKSEKENISVLLDASGGRGIDTPIKVLPNAGKHFKVGYAGGFNPENVAEKLIYLYEQKEVGDFWIDMESGVRTDDWFDIDKVRSVLEICMPIIKRYKEE
ncbi:MAG: hypothetical protein IJM43_08100 [Bacteroidaceae bacterium]|nr:hypothetical protein [Bacteroidaceae bacterium]